MSEVNKSVENENGISSVRERACKSGRKNTRLSTLFEIVAQKNEIVYEVEHPSVVIHLQVYKCRDTVLMKCPGKSGPFRGEKCDPANQREEGMNDLAKKQFLKPEGRILIETRLGRVQLQGWNPEKLDPIVLTVFKPQLHNTLINVRFPNLARAPLPLHYVAPFNLAQTAATGDFCSSDEDCENPTLDLPTTSIKPTEKGKRHGTKYEPHQQHYVYYSNTPSYGNRDGTRKDPQPVLKSSEKSSAPANFMHSHDETGLFVRICLENLKKRARSQPPRLYFIWIKHQLKNSWLSSSVTPTSITNIFIYRALHLVCFVSLAIFDNAMENAETSIDLHPTMLLALAYVFAHPSIVSDLKEMPQSDWIAEKAEAFKEYLYDWWISKPEIRCLLRQCLRIIRKIE